MSYGKIKKPGMASYGVICTMALPLLNATYCKAYAWRSFQLIFKMLRSREQKF